MGGRGQVSYAGGAGSSAVASARIADRGRGAAIAAELGVSEQRGAEIFDAINRWADDSTGIKNAQRGGAHSDQDAKDAAALEEFISKSPSYQGELIRVMNVEGYRKPRKNGKIDSDGSITSWTVPGNYSNAMNGFGGGSGQTVVLHVNASKGADTRGFSWLSSHDSEILQSGGYEASLTVQRVQTRTERTMEYPEGRSVIHVYLRE